jgi:hypothetical protein
MMVPYVLYHWVSLEGSDAVTLVEESGWGSSVRAVLGFIEDRIYFLLFRRTGCNNYAFMVSSRTRTVSISFSLQQVKYKIFLNPRGCEEKRTVNSLSQTAV